MLLLFLVHLKQECQILLRLLQILLLYSFFIFPFLFNKIMAIVLDQDV